VAGPIYEWGSWYFEPTESRLMRNGTIVPLPGKSLELLATLLRRSPRLVTKEEILQKVWPDAAVEEGNIAFHVAALRKVLDQGESESSIETVRGKGYRFVHTVGIRQMPPTDMIDRPTFESALAAATAAAAPTAVPPTTTAPAAPSAARQPRWGLVVGAIALAAIAAIVWFAF
jgi:DNA-binding winged helix-turn-helix (wHTH) protein